MLLLTKIGGGKPPFPTCKLTLVEWSGSPRANLKVGKGGLPPLEYRQGQRLSPKVG